MKKNVYFCCMMLLSINATAQLEMDDHNWELFFVDDFSGNRGWNATLWEDQNFDESNYVPLWKCFADSYWGSGVISKKATHLHQAYQKDNVSFINGTLRLHGEYISDTPLTCGLGYFPAPWIKYHHYCDPPEGQHKAVFYRSGIIESIEKIKYGYFEIKCKLPFHPGSFPAFWLYDNSCDDNYYEEIDIMEYSYGSSIGNGTPNKYSHGFLLDKHDCACPDPLISYGKIKNLPAGSDITDWQIYGCEWTPGRITWYLNGSIIDDYYDLDSVPSHPLTLIANYAINNGAVSGTYPNQTPTWRSENNMVIDYVKVLQLKCDCENDTYITNENELANYDHQVKHAVEIGSTTGIMALSTTDVTIRASDHVLVTGLFEVPIGAKLTMMVHPCPYPEE